MVGTHYFYGTYRSQNRLGAQFPVLRLTATSTRDDALLGDRNGIETLLRNGRGNMPAVGKNWSAAQIDALIAWTKQYATTGAAQ